MSARIELVVEKTLTKIAPYIREPLNKVPDLETGLNNVGKCNDISLLSIEIDNQQDYVYVTEPKPIPIPYYPLQNIVIEK